MPSLKKSNIRLFFTLIGILIFILYLIYTNPFKVLFELGRFDPYIFTLAVILNYLGLFSLAISWYIILRILNIGISLWNTIQITFVSMFVVWIFPIPSGVELIRAYLVRNKSGSNIGKAVSSVLLNKVYYFIAFGVLITLGGVMVTFIQGESIPVDVRYVWFVVIYALTNTFLFFIILRPKTLLKIYHKSPYWVRRKIFNKIYGSQKELGGFEMFVKEVDNSIKELRKSTGLNLISLLFIAFHWSTGSITAFLVAISLGYHIDFWVIILIYAVIEFIQQLNILIPSGLGIVDAGLTGALLLLGIPLSDASAISLLTRLATYWFELVLCGLVAINYGYKEVLREL